MFAAFQNFVSNLSFVKKYFKTSDASHSIRKRKFTESMLYGTVAALRVCGPRCEKKKSGPHNSMPEIIWI